MSWRLKAATAISTIAMTVGGMLATAPHAAAVGGCSSGYLCVYDGTDFTGDKIASASTNSCYDILAFTDFGYIRSYVSNLSVKALVWNYYASGGWTVARTLPAGGFSSDIGISGLGEYGAVCTGGQVPSDYPWG